jgi:hypothetical protein
MVAAASEQASANVQSVCVGDRRDEYVH